jgi:hypothetical protein
MRPQKVIFYTFKLPVWGNGRNFAVSKDENNIKV